MLNKTRELMMILLSQIHSVRRLLMFGGKKQQRHITTINITQPAQKLGSQLAGLKVSTVEMLVSYWGSWLYASEQSTAQLLGTRDRSREQITDWHLINLLTNISLPILTSLSGGTETSIVHCPLNESSKYAIHCRIFPRKRSRQCSEATSSGRSFSRPRGPARAAISGEVLTGKSGVGNTGSRHPAPGHWPLVTTRHSCLLHTCLPGTASHPRGAATLGFLTKPFIDYICSYVRRELLEDCECFLLFLFINCPYPLSVFIHYYTLFVGSLLESSSFFPLLLTDGVHLLPPPLTRRPCRRRSQLSSLALSSLHRRSLLSPLPALESSDPCSVRAQCAPGRVTTNITSPELRDTELRH